MTSEADLREPIAVVGIGCRLPGGADDPTSLWRLLGDRFDAIGPIPSDRFDAEALYDERPATPGHIMSRWGGFLPDIDRFDAEFFHIAPREAERLDPQQRLLLETTWEALEDAGIPSESIAGSHTGVFVGVWINDLEARLFADPDAIDFHMTTGTGRYAASGRLSYFLDLLGPSITIDTACSSSLVAVHLARQSLATGECDLALAGGSNVILQPSITIAYSQSRMMAPDGRCKFGDASGDGYVRSDGAAIIALKRLSDAVADGDRIHAVIRGSAVTNDGRTSGYLATPGQAGQEQMLRRAYHSAAVDPSTVQYIEAHGTGTAAGDPVELGAIGAVVGPGRDADRPCYVGSIKTNLGHCEGAAGVAGLIKVALALEHGEIPASLHLREPNPDVPWDELHLRVPTDPVPLTAGDAPARAGVSSFGIAGTNAHVVLESPSTMGGRERSEERAGPFVLPISARSDGALRELAGDYATLIESGDASLDDICAAAAGRRSQLERRVTIVADDGAHLAEALAAVADDRAHPAATSGVVASVPRVVFVFPGQGSQWIGMARALLADEPVFRGAIERCDAAIRAEAGWSPLEVLADDDASRLEEIDVVQPVLFAIQVALAEQWASWGIAPCAVVGHSMGEVAAAHVAGALTLEDAVSVICLRSRLLRRISGQGAMAVVDLPRADALAALAGREHELSIAASNSPRSTVIAGDPAALDEVLAELQAEDVFCRLVKVDVASHSPQVEPLVDELRAGLDHLVPRQGRVAFHSTVDAVELAGDRLDADYWSRNLRQPVQFAEVAGQLASSGPVVFVELSPHPILLPAIEQASDASDGEAVTVATMRREQSERATMLTALASLHVHGVDVDWPAVVGRPTRHVDLPTYRWQRERYWYEPRSAGATRGGGHRLLGHDVRPADAPGAVYWQSELAAADVEFLDGHVVQGEAIMPAAGFAELARAAVVETFQRNAVEVSSLELLETLPVERDAARTVQVTVEPRWADTFEVRVFSAEQEGDTWRLHARCLVGPPAVDLDGERRDVDAIRRRCTHQRDGADHLAAMRARGLRYSGAFESVVASWLGDGEVLGQLQRAERPHEPSDGRIPLVDGCLQLAEAAIPSGLGDPTYLPVRIGGLLISPGGIGDGQLWGHVRVLERDAESIRCDIDLLDADGALAAAMRGVELVRLGGSGHVDDLLYELRWQSVERGPATDDSSGGGWIVYSSDPFGAAVADLLRAAGDDCVEIAPGASSELDGDRLVVRPGVAEDHRSALRHALARWGGRVSGIVYAWGVTIGAEGGDAIAAAEQLGCVAPIELVRAVVEGDASEVEPRVWLVTRGAQRAGDDDTAVIAAPQAVLWGLGRVIANEHPALRCTLVDADPAADASALVDELRAGADDRQVALRGEDRRVPSLEHLQRDAHPAALRTESATYRLASTDPGSLDGLRLQLAARRVPAAGEIEIRVDASALNFLDVLKSMGIYPGLDPGADVALGAECAGTVSAVGEGVGEFRVGDEVVAVTSSYDTTPMLASHVVVPAAFAVSRPPQVSAVEASALPVAYLTAYHALVELARLRPGERVLVHSATGGVGLAAIEICRHIGAEVFATAGNEAKREHLRAMGIEHVYDSRSTAFAEAVQVDTAGAGVDVVLNSLVGEAIPAGLSTLAPRGRFVEIGKRDVHAGSHLGLDQLKRNVSFFVVDLAGLTEQDPSAASRLFREAMALVADRHVGTLPTTAAPITEAPEAFRAMAAAGHIGKLVLTVPGEPVPVELRGLRPGAAYLITGGLGALGLALAARFVDRGARHLVLVGRSAPSAAAKIVLDDLRDRGAVIEVLEVDVTDATALTKTLAEARDGRPPLCGVVHAAGTLADATLVQMDLARLREALAPKLAGGWNLHAATLDDPLDFFVSFSSVAGVLGLSGQANYAAGNAFLDALSHARHAAGAPGLSIDWGPWAEIGLAAAADDRGARLADRGLHGLAPTEALDALDLLLAGDRAQVVAMRLHAREWVDSTPSATLLAGLVGDEDDTSVSARAPLRDRLLATPAGPRRRSELEGAVCAELAPVLRTAPERLDRTRTLEEMGVDSLMALEFRNRLETETGVKLSATLAFNYPTVSAIAEHLAGRMDIALDRVDDDGTDADDPPMDEVAPSTPAEEREMSRDDVEAMLADELAAAERLLEADGRTST